jgi:hypothetical protein
MSLFFFLRELLCEDFDMNFDVKDGFLYLHDDTVPVHSRFEISMESDKYTDAQRKKFSLRILIQRQGWI